MKFTQKANRIFLVCNILIPLVIGAYIYIYWDSDSYFGNFARSILAVPNTGAGSNIAQIMRNWGCDLLYAYALLFALYASTGNISVSIRYAAICTIGLELLQLIQVDFLKCGTFDVWDILVEIIAICFAATLIGFCNHIKKKNGGKNSGR